MKPEYIKHEIVRLTKFWSAYHLNYKTFGKVAVAKRARSGKELTTKELNKLISK